MSNEYNENGANAPVVIDTPVEGTANTGIVPVNNENVHEISGREALIGTTVGAAVVILAWEGAKKFWKKVIVPVCENVVEKAHKEKGSEKDPLEEPPAKKGGKEESAENAGDPEKRSKFIGAKALRARKGK